MNLDIPVFFHLIWIDNANGKSLVLKLLEHRIMVVASVLHEDGRGFSKSLQIGHESFHLRLRMSHCKWACQNCTV